MKGFTNWIRYLLAAKITLSTCWAVLPKLLFKPKLSKSKYITDNSGRIVIYRGVNVSNVSKHSGPPSGYWERGRAQHPWHGRDDFKKLEDWGFNFVRYLIFWEAIEPSRGNYDDDYLTGAVNRAKYLGRHGVDVVLDMHQDLYGQRFHGNGFPDWTVRDDGKKFKLREPWSANYLEPAVMRSFKNFWQSDDLKSAYLKVLEHVIDAAEDIPNIIGIDVMNEPWPRFPPMPFERKRLTAFYEKIEELFLRKGTRLKMFYEPWMSTSSGVPTNLRFQPRIPAVFFPHFYDAFCEDGRPYKKWNKALMRRAIEIKLREAQKFGVPMAIGEFSLPPSCEGHLKALSDFVSLSDEYAFGWSYYSYETTLQHSRGLVLPDGSETPILKRITRPYAQRIAGRNPKMKYKDGIFSLKYEKHPNVSGKTEIFAPAGAHYNISCSGMVEIKGSKIFHTNSHDRKQFVHIGPR